MLKTYTHLVLCFPIPDDTSSRNSIVKALEAAANKLTTAFPWLAGKVVNEGSCPRNSGLFKVAPFASHEPPKTIVRVKDCTDICPPHEDVIKARRPISMLNGYKLAPRKAYPETYQESEADPAPVLVLQVNFVKGGLLLNLAAQHNIVDMAGIDQCFRLLAAAMRVEEFSNVSIEEGNRDRRNLVPLLGPNDTKSDHSHFRPPLPSEAIPPPAEPDSPFSWCYFRFSAGKLAQIKALATRSEAKDNSVPFISTSDALSAFCWKRVITVRLHRSQTHDAIAKFSRAVDARRAMGVQWEYMGNLVTGAISRVAFDDVENASLPALAEMMRGDVIRVNQKHHVRSIATFINSEPDKSIIRFGGRFNPDTDIGSSSWAHVALYGAEFGSLGKPTLIRRPNFVPLRSFIYFMPKMENGDIDALVCFNEADMHGLRSDPEWNEYADFIG